MLLPKTKKKVDTNTAKRGGEGEEIITYDSYLGHFQKAHTHIAQKVLQTKIVKYSSLNLHTNTITKQQGVQARQQQDSQVTL